MATPIRGRDVLMYVFKDGAYAVLACAKTVGIEFDIDEIPIATQNSGTDDDYDPGFSRGTATFEHLATLDETTKYQFEDFIDNRRSRHQVKIVFTDSLGAILQYEFAAIVKRYGGTASFNGFVQATGVFRICGPITKTRVYSPGSNSGSAPPVTSITGYSDTWTTTPGAYEVSGTGAGGTTMASLSGKTILLVFRSGANYPFIGYSGTLVALQSKYDNSTQKIVFDSSLVFNTGETITVLWQQ